ncbi:unnamed protein product [Camellia sinensis]
MEIYQCYEATTQCFRCIKALWRSTVCWDPAPPFHFLDNGGMQKCDTRSVKSTLGLGCGLGNSHLDL